MDGRTSRTWLGVIGLAVVALIVVPVALRDDNNSAAGFDGHIQSGTCTHPGDEVVVDFESEEDANDVEPYVAIDANGKPITLGYYGSPGMPGFGFAAIYTGKQFSMVITNPDNGDAVACGDILQPAADRFREVGLAVVQLLPRSGDIQGVAVIERTALQRELDITPTRVRIILTSGDVEVPAQATDGYDGYIGSGQCASPTDDVHVDLKSRDDPEVTPFEAELPGSGDVTVAYSGAPGAPGFGLESAYGDEHFSLVITDPNTEAARACGDILEPDDDAFIEAGLALVALRPVGDDGVQGYAVIERTALQRELDITPTRVRVVLFAPPVADR